MRKFGSTKRNPNPIWPGVQNSVILPPGTNSSVTRETKENSKPNDIIKVADRESENVHERDGFIPIMSYMTEGGMAMPPADNIHNRKCSYVSVTDYLCDKTGNYARVEFMFGENTHIEKTGVLESVGKDFVVLTEAGTGSHIVCSAKNIKFINIYNIK